MLERFIIEGDLAAPGFLPWVERHARRLGLGLDLRETGPERVTLAVEGAPALLDAMEMGCLLGPIEVWVERIRREPSVERI